MPSYNVLDEIRMVEVTTRVGCFETPLSGGAHFRHRRTQSDVHRWISSQPRHRGHRRSENQLSPQCFLTSTIPQTVFLIVWFLEVWSSLFLTYCLCISLRLANHDAQWVSKTQNSKIVITRHHSSLRNWLSPSSLMQPFNYYNLFVSTISKTSFSISETWAKVAVLTLASVR